MAPLDWLQQMLGGRSASEPYPPNTMADVGTGIPLSLGRTPVPDTGEGTALAQLLGKLGDIGVAIPGVFERAQLGGMNALGMRQPGGDIYRSKIPVAPGVEALADAANFATGGLQSSLFPAAGAYREAARYALPKSAEIGREAAAALPGLLADETGAIRAYHGSPHSFDKFDLSKIGTGEGAQAYGHGLYFAEAEDVARGYRDTLAGKAPLREYGGQPLETNRDWWGLIDRVEPEDWRLAKIIDVAGKAGGIRTALDLFEPYTRNASDAPQWAAAIEKFKEGVGPAAKGHMYEVDIHADPKSFLDWDKPIGQQSAEVQERLRPGLAPYMTMQPMGTAIRQAGESPSAASLLFNRESKPLALTPGEVSERLRDLGIPGSRYLDQGSRVDPAATQSKIALYEGLIRNDPTAAERAGWMDRIAALQAELTKPQTSNYAVFDDKLIEILRKYGILPPIAAGGGLLATQGEPPT